MLISQGELAKAMLGGFAAVFLNPRVMIIYTNPTNHQLTTVRSRLGLGGLR